MITTPFLKASTAPPPYPKSHRRVGAGFRTHSPLPFGVKCLHCYPGLTFRARAADGTTHSERLDVRPFARISRSSNQETSSVAVNPQPSYPPPPSYVGSPLFWIGVGVGLSALFSWVAANLKKYAMQQAFKTMMGQMNPQNNQFNDAAFSSGSPFPFSMPPMPAPSTSPPPVTSQSAVTVDVPATNVEAAPTTVVKDETEVKKESRRVAFVDVSPEEAEQKNPYESFKDASGTSSFKDAQIAGVVSQNGAASERIGGSEWSQATTNPAGSELSQSTRNSTASEGSQSTGKSVISVDVLEKMMQDPTVQKMVYPHLPEEFRNPDTLKWMLQNPQYRQQLEEMLNNMNGSSEWDKRMMDSLKNFDLNSPDVKQQFDQIGLSPEETIAKIMANNWIVRFYYLGGLKMYAVERLGSYITRGVYTVSGPFHPFGGAVDIIVVEQQDGSFKSSPWYVRFGKFQGVLKAKEKVVNISVNGVEADFHMYLDHKGEAYFVRELDVEEGETVPYSVSSGDETDGGSQNDRRPLKSKSYNFDANTSNSVEKIDVLRNGKALARTTSRRPRILGLVFGRRRLMKEEGYQDGEGDDSVARADADSLERAEIAANLLEVNWSTNFPINKHRKDNAKKDVQITDGKGEVSSSEHGSVKNSLDPNVLHEETGSHNVQMGESSLSGFENLQSFVEETKIEVACFSTPERVTETSVAGEGVLEGKHEMVSTLSRKIYVGDTENDENAKVQYSIEHEEHPGKHIDEEQVFHVTNVLPGCGISQDESKIDRVCSYIYCETSERSIVIMDRTSEQTCETMYLASGGLGEVHVHAEMLHSTTELLSEDTVTLQVAEDGEFQTEPVEDPDNHSQQMNHSHSFIQKCNVMDLEGPSIVPEVHTQMVHVDPTLGLDDKLESQSICTISGFSNSAHQAQDKENKDEEITSKFQPSLESIGDCIPTKAISTLSSGSSEDEQFLFSDLDEISEVQRMESISPVNVDKESPSSRPEGIKEANRSVNERYDPSLFSEKSAQENPFIDLEGSIEKLRISSSPIIIPRSHEVSGEEVGRPVESLPNLWSHTVSPDAHDFRHPLSQSLDSSSKSLYSKLQSKDDSSYIKSDIDPQLALGQPNIEDAQVSVEPIDVLANSSVGDPSKSSVASGGGWRIWPFSFRNSRSKKGLQPVPIDHRNSDAENTSESTTGMDGDKNVLKPKVVRKIVRALIPTSEQLASMNLKEGSNTVTFTFSTKMLGKQQVDARIYLWKWNTRIVISDVDGTITKSDVLGQFMPLVGIDWSQTGVAHLFSAIKENGYQLLFLSARAISQAYHTRQFLFNLKQDGKALPDGPVVISPDGLFPSLYREVIRRAPHEFKISCLEDIRALFPSDCNPFYAGFGNRDTDEFSYLKVGIPKGKVFIINPKGEVAVNRRVDTRSYGSLHALVHGMFPPMTSSEQEDFNSWNYWKLPAPVINV